MTLSSLDSVGSLAVILMLVTAVSILLLIHNLYLSATPASRFGLRMLSVGLGAAMVYDLNIYTIAFLKRAVSSNMFNMRGVAMVIVLTLLILDAHRKRGWHIQLSNSVAFQTYSLMRCVLFLILMALEVFGRWVVGREERI